MAQRAIEQDPQAAAAFAIVGVTYMQEVFMGWTRDPISAVEQAVRFGRQSVALDGTNPEGHLILGWVFYLQGQHDQGIAMADKAVQLSPNSADATAGLADLYNLAGRAQEGLILIRRAMRQSPIYPPYYLSVLGHAHRLTGKLEDAIVIYQRYLEMEPDNRRARPNLAIVYAQLGRENDARAQATEIRRQSPQFSLARWARLTPYRNPGDLQSDLDALRRLGFD